MITDRLFKRFSIGVIAAWLLLFSLLPFLLVLVASFLRQGDTQFFSWHFTFNNYLTLFHSLYLQVFLRSFYLATITCLLCLLLGYPFAYILAKLPEKFRMVLLFFLVIPFWTSSLIRIYSLVIIIRGEGLLNHLLLWLHIIQQPLQILYTQTAVLIGLVYALLPFMVLPLYANLEKFDWQLVDAAYDLGAKKWRVLTEVIIPLSVPGIIAGVMLVLLPAMTMFYIPDILGGAKSLLLGNLIKNQFIEASNWPLGSAVSVALTFFMGLMLLAYWNMTTAKERRELV
jgi:spermidine/putrescine transport system permease protein